MLAFFVTGIMKILIMKNELSLHNFKHNNIHPRILLIVLEQYIMHILLLIPTIFPYKYLEICFSYKIIINCCSSVPLLSFHAYS
jgi:hypothetical protein